MHMTSCLTWSTIVEVENVDNLIAAKLEFGVTYALSLQVAADSDMITDVL